MKTAAELADAILNWQSVQRTDAQWTKLDMTPLSALIQQYRDAVLEEAVESDVGKLCRACRFWRGNGGKDESASCRRRAPEHHIGSAGDETCRWPQTRDTDWCGEWEADRS